MSEGNLPPVSISILCRTAPTYGRTPWFLRVFVSSTWQSISARRLGLCARMDVPLACVPRASRRSPRPLCPRRHSSAPLTAPPCVASGLARSAVAYRVADRAAVIPSWESRRRSCGSYSPSVTGIVRKESHAHDLLRLLLNSGEGVSPSSPPHLLSIYSPSSSLEASSRTEHRGPRRRTNPRTPTSRRTPTPRTHASTHRRSPTPLADKISSFSFLRISTLHL